MPNMFDEFEGMRTFHGWRSQGRSVTAGEMAEHYLVAGTSTAGLFREDQTSPDHAAADIGGDWYIVAAADRPRKTKAPRDPRDALKVDYNSETKRVSIWTGPSRSGIDSMKRSNFWFSSTAHRWIAQRDDIAPVVKALHESGKFRLAVTVDGVACELTDDGEIREAVVLDV